ncbi:MAG: potassium transporter TrkG, partial [Pseudomonadota bacterium]
MRRISRALFLSPSRMSVVAFAALIAIGTALLMLPQAGVTRPLGAVEALFTSTSAACVTGLVVLDTGSALTVFGQIVVLVLIQVGGLGIMTLSTLMILMAGRRPRLVDRVLVHDTFTQGGERSFSSILRDVMIFTAAIEGTGALLLFFRFLPHRGVGESLYFAVFHAVSSFCNAGFSLFSDSFISYRQDWVLNLVICFLIVSGGIGFLVLSELKRRLPFKGRTWSRLSLHSKLVLSTTAILLVLGSVLITGMEWHNTLAPLPVSGRFLAGVFQSVTARTAGFNTLPIGDMANETLFILILLMFIGASPGSCGGGIKTSTLASLVALGVSRFQGRERTRIFHRSITQESVGKAISVVMVGMVVIVLATLILLMTELGEISHRVSRGRFLDYLFEVVSAFGTVGLSTGVTAGLTATGKIVLT